MPELRFEEEEERQPLKSQRMTDTEAKAVIELWAEKHREEERRRSMPSVQDVAAGLDIPAEEAYRLLQEVRAKEAVERIHSQETTVQQTRARNYMATKLIAAAVGLFVAIMLLYFLTEQSIAPPTVAPVPIASPVVAEPPAPARTTPTSGPDVPAGHPTTLPR